MSNKTLIIEALQQKVETLTFWDDFLLLRHIVMYSCSITGCIVSTFEVEGQSKTGRYSEIVLKSNHDLCGVRLYLIRHANEQRRGRKLGDRQIDPIHDFNFYCGGFYVKLENKLLRLGSRIGDMEATGSLSQVPKCALTRKLSNGLSQSFDLLPQIFLSPCPRTKYLGGFF